VSAHAANVHEAARIAKSGSGRLRKLRGVASLVRPYRTRAWITFGAMLLSVAAGLTPPLLAGLAVNEVKDGHVGALTIIVIVFLVAAVLNWASSYLETYLVNLVGQRVLQDLRIQLFRHLQKLSIGFYSRSRAGVLISRLTNDVEALNQLVTDGIYTIVSAGLTLVGTAAILVVLDAKLALVTFIVFPILAGMSLWFRINSAGAYRATREKLASVTAYLQETLSGVRIVRAFGQEERHKARLAELNAEYRDVNMRTVVLNAAYFPAVELLSALATAVILLYGGSRAIDGAVSIGVLVAYVGYLSNFFDPIQQLSQVYTTYQAGMAALDKIFELLDEEPDLQDAPDAVDLPTLRGEIEFDHVSFRYGAEDDGGFALRDVNLHIPPGQTIALVGATGAGKSTFVKLVARFYDPGEGAVRIDGHDLRTVAQRSLREQLGIVPQEGFLFSGTVKENIAFGRPDASDDDVRAAAKAVGAHEFICALPNGYETEVGERGIQLSGGQRQLVAFARAACADPRILILDEPTSNVDVHTEGRIEHGLRRLLAGRTAIVIAHRLSTIRNSSRILVMDAGQIVESGTHDELIAAGGAYARLYQDWAEQAA
jgi:ATP-binding cassette subfamily B protein